MPQVTPNAGDNKGVLVLDSWSGGEYGQLAPWLASPDQWTGLNLLVYPDGSVGPRYGLIEVALTGVTPTGVVLGLGYNTAADAAGFKNTVFVITTAVHVFDRDDGAAMTCATALGETATSPIPMVTKSVKTYLSVPDGKMYYVTHQATPDVTALTASSTVFSPGLTCLVQYGERLVAAGSGKAPDGTAAPGNRVYFSTAGDPEAWEATNFFDVGQDAAVTALLVHRENLLIATADGRWWTLRGTLGTDGNAVLRETLQGVSPADPDHWASLSDGLCAYVIGSSSTGSIGSVGRFTGTTTRLFDSILFGEGRSRTPATAPSFTVVPLKESGDFFIHGGAGNAANDAFVFVRGVPTVHEWAVASVTLSGFCSSSGRSADRHLLTDGGDTGVTPRFFLWRAYATRPGFAGDTNVQPGDDTTASLSGTLTTAEFHAPSDMEVLVRSVTVDFKSWDNDSATDNLLTLVVDAVRPWEASGVVSSAAQNIYDAATSASSASGTVRRVTKNFGDQGYGNGFKLRFTAVRGCAISKVTVQAVFRPSYGQEA